MSCLDSFELVRIDVHPHNDFEHFGSLVRAAMIASFAPARCCGITKSGQLCSIKSSSTMRDSLGRLVAEPLRRGSAFCMLHTVLFRVEPVHVRDALIVYMDLETNSLDVLTGKVVEIGALIEGSNFVFSTVVNTGLDESIDQPSVHGISASELLSGPCFSEAFLRFDAFLRHAALKSYINPSHGTWPCFRSFPNVCFLELRRVDLGPCLAHSTIQNVNQTNTRVRK